MSAKRRVYYEVRTEQGDGEFDWFVVPPDDPEDGYDPRNKRSAIKAARNHGAAVFRVVETEVPYK